MPHNWPASGSFILLPLDAMAQGEVFLGLFFANPMLRRGPDAELCARGSDAELSPVASGIARSASAARRKRATMNDPPRASTSTDTRGPFPEHEPCRPSDSALARCEAGSASASLRPRRARLCIGHGAGGGRLEVRHAFGIGHAESCGRVSCAQPGSVRSHSLGLPSLRGSQPYPVPDSGRDHRSDVHRLPHGRWPKYCIIRLFHRVFVRHLSPQRARVHRGHALHAGGIRCRHQPAAAFAAAGSTRRALRIGELAGTCGISAVFCHDRRSNQHAQAQVARERDAFSQPDRDVLGLLLGERRRAPAHAGRAGR